MNGGWPVMAILMFPDFVMRIVNGITSVEDKNDLTRIVFNG